ncbi:sperm flagellar protein 1-like isoform X2 [Physella acuta]|uniref:sperm flagellar protein 1-like isoform X2 n=1 Tax=Physella acuta TaxID=109671 RepID=UPI0027DAE32C|nr:sperm flagellar protein 1-like isoform X2 [Physella acuta]
MAFVRSNILVAEIFKHYFPRHVDVHNYAPAVGVKQKMENWFLLNRKVLHRLDLDLSEDVIRSLSSGKQSVVEKVLMMLRFQIDKHIDKYNSNRARQKYHKSPREMEDFSCFGPSSPRLTSRDYQIKSHKPLPELESSELYNRSYPNGPMQDSMVNYIPRDLFEQKVLESLAKDETIQMLTVKLQKLEQLLRMKNERIENLERKLA